MNTPLLIGIDAGGTHTDAVVCRSDDHSVLATAKAPTDHTFLEAGILSALSTALDRSGRSAADIGAVAISTTLATNALVEGTGPAAGLVAIGMDPLDLERAGLGQALGGGPTIHIGGGHDSHGLEAAPLDLEVLDARLAQIENDGLPGGFAVAGTFAVRNPSHERTVQEIISSRTGRPVTCSHHLSDQLNGPRRAVTAVLNTRLVPLATSLLAAVASSLRDLDINAPLMVVRGDGSLVSAQWAAQRPVDTILSGPAASITGALHLAGRKAAVIADMGGTTTDVAVITGPNRTPRVTGAVVGGHHTMVEALDIRTTGLGGDSHVRVNRFGDGTPILGPNRVTPLGVATVDHPGILAILRGQVAHPVSKDTDGIVALATTRNAMGAHDPHETAILERLTHGPAGIGELDRRATTRQALDRLVRSGSVRLAAFTPTDAAALTDHPPTPLGPHHVEASRLGAELLARVPTGKDACRDMPVDELVHVVLHQWEVLTATAILAAIVEADGLPPSTVHEPMLFRHLQLADAAPDALIDIALRPRLPLVGVGGPSSQVFPGVAQRLGAEVIVPPNAEVANAVGAAIGTIRITRQVVISAPRRGLYRVHWGEQPPTMYDLDEAVDSARSMLADELERAAALAGAADHHVEMTWEPKEADIGGRSLFVEGVLTATATGRPVAATGRPDQP